MQTTSRKIQTAFRLDEMLISRLKLKALKERKSLNRLVEESLERVAPAEPEWPRIKFPIEPDPVLAALKFNVNFTPEEIAADERLAYILRK